MKRAFTRSLAAVVVMGCLLVIVGCAKPTGERSAGEYREQDLSKRTRGPDPYRAPATAPSTRAISSSSLER
jgi:hypothetical protein